jgi:hypothetical protein
MTATPKCLVLTGMLGLMIFTSPKICAQTATIETPATEATDAQAKPDAEKMGPKKINYAFIIKNHPAGTLYGNPCFLDVSHSYGFEYLIVPEGVAPNKNGMSRAIHNLGVNIKLLFRNGPFWKSRLKKKYEKCKYSYGDFVG